MNENGNQTSKTRLLFTKIYFAVVFGLALVVVALPAFCVLVFLPKLTPANRFCLIDACERALRAAA